jgi:DNA repair protein RadC
VLELAKRIRTDSDEAIVRAADIYKLSFNIARKKQEHFMLITLNGASCVIKKRIIFVGTINQSVIHPREIFHHAIKDRAASIIIVHNHPSGDTTPSKEDVNTTTKIKRIGELVGINLLEHLVVSPTGYFSFYKSGLI